ncbi:MAG: BACON domain-containing protein, partial [Planctomycetota bacterium]
MLEVSSNSYSFSALAAGTNPGDQLLTVSNTGNKTLNWSIDTTGKPAWLTITPISGSLGNGGSEPVTLSVDITGLSAGQYNYAFDVVDPNAQQSPQTVTVDLEIVVFVPNLMARWHLDGDATDASGNGHDGTVYGNPTWVAGVEGTGAIELDGIDDYIEIEGYTGVTGTQPRTVTAWINTDAPNEGTIVRWGHNVSGGYWRFHFDSAGRLRLDAGGGSAGGSASARTDLRGTGWRHVAVVLADDGTMTTEDIQFYVDGVLDGLSVIFVVAINTTEIANVRVGEFNIGMIDDVRIYDRALSELEIKEMIGPILNTSSSTVSFVAPEGGANPADQMLTITNTGGGTLNWSVDTTGKPAWLTITPTSGSLASSGSESVTLSADITGISAGQYSYAFDVSDPAAANSPQTVTVDLDVVGPILGVSNTAFSFTVLEGGANPADQILTVQNTGGGTVNWSIDTTGKPAWLTIIPTSGALTNGQSELVTLSVGITGLPEGSYSYAFDVSDPAATNSPQTVTVQLGIDDFIYVPNDYPTIQAAIDAADPNGLDTVIVLPGTYAENINFSGKDIILSSTNPTDPNIVAATIIDGNASGSVVTFAGTETSACELRGFTITNGIGTLISSSRYGGGVYGNNTQATITYCTITGNTAGNHGGGLYQCHGPITHCTITGNTAGNHGGGLYQCHGLITHCVIRSNTAEYGDGGGFFECHGPITNCMIMNNDCRWNGGGLSLCEGTITNCTIVYNYTEPGISEGGGLAFCNGQITNCILWGNWDGIWGLGGQVIGADPIITYSCIQNWTGGGTGNISGNPMFADPSPAPYDLHLLAGSPCIDAGTNAPPGGLPAT